MNTIKFLFTIIVFSTSFNLTAQNGDLTEKEHRVKNKIKEICTYNHNINYKDSTITNKSVYDTIGNLVEDHHFDEGDLLYKNISEYQNNLLVKQYAYYKGESLSSTLNFDYDERGNQTDYKQISVDGTLFNFHRRKYNEKNQQIEFYTKKAEGDSLFLKHKYYYKENGKYSKFETFDETGKLVREDELIYDKKDNLITINEFENGLKMSSHYYTFNKKNFLVESNHLIKNNEMIRGKHKLITSTRKIKWKYDSEGNTIEEILFENDYLYAKTTFSYTKF